MSEIKINLPATSFPMKANLPTKEPEIIKLWEQINLYQELRSNSKGREKLFCMMVLPMQMDIFILEQH